MVLKPWFFFSFWEEASVDARSAADRETDKTSKEGDGRVNRKKKARSEAEKRMDDDTIRESIILDL